MDHTPLILVVDDEQVNRSVLRWALTDAGFRVALAASGPQARQMILDDAPDLIILDIMMPLESGFDTCRKLQDSPATRDIPIIFVSGMAEVDDKVRGLKLGAVDYVTKPFSGEEVVARVKIHLRLRQANRALIAEQAAKLSQIRNAQQAILVSPNDAPEAKFAVVFRPAQEAGGDFYDVFGVSPARHAYFVADVSGHDLAASFMTASLKALIRQNASPIYSPEDTLRNMNSVLCSVLAPGQHLSAAYLTVNRPSGRVRLVNAGHPPVIHVSAKGQTHVLAPEGDLLGAFESVHVEAMDIKADPGDRFYMFTDGLMDLAGPSMGAALDRLRQLLHDGRGNHLADTVAFVADTLTPRGVPPADDVVLLGIEV